MFNGEETTFALNPDGAVHIVPATAGTKRYRVYDAIDPIPGCCDFRLSTRDMGGCFMTTEIEGGKLVMKSYLVDDKTQEITLIDKYAIKKDVGQNKPAEDYEDLPTDNVSNIGNYVKNFVSAIVDMLIKYVFVLLPQAIKKAIKK